MLNVTVNLDQQTNKQLSNQFMICFSCFGICKGHLFVIFRLLAAEHGKRKTQSEVVISIHCSEFLGGAC